MLDIEKDFINSREYSNPNFPDNTEHRQNLSVTCLLVPNPENSVKFSPKSRVTSSPRHVARKGEATLVTFRGISKKELFQETIRLKNVIVNSEVQVNDRNHRIRSAISEHALQLLAERKLRLANSVVPAIDVVRTLNLSLDSRRRQVAELAKENHEYIQQLATAQDRYRHVWMQKLKAESEVQALKKRCLALESQTRQTSSTLLQERKESAQLPASSSRLRPQSAREPSQSSSLEEECSPTLSNFTTAEETIDPKDFPSQASPVIPRSFDEDLPMTPVSQNASDNQSEGSGNAAHTSSRFKFGAAFRETFHHPLHGSFRSKPKMSSQPLEQAASVEGKILTEKLGRAEAQISMLLQELGTLRTDVAVKVASQQVAESLGNDSKGRNGLDTQSVLSDNERLTALVQTLEKQWTDAAAELREKEVDSETLDLNLKNLTEENLSLKAQLTAIRTRKFKELYPDQTERELRESLQDSEDRRLTAQDRVKNLERRVEAERQKMASLKDIFAKERKLNANVHLIQELQDKVVELESNLAAARCDPLQLLCDYNGIGTSSGTDSRSLSTKAFRIEQEKIKRYPDLQRTVDIFERQMKILTEEAYKNKVLAEKWRSNKWAVDDELKDTASKLFNAEKQLMMLRMESDGKGEELMPILEATQWELMRTLCELGGLLRKKQNGTMLHAAFEKYSKALLIAENQRENEGFVNWSAWEQEIAQALTNMGSIRFEQKEYPDAKILFEKAHAIRLSKLGAEHPLTTKCDTHIQRCIERMSGEAESEDGMEEFQTEEI